MHALDAGTEPGLGKSAEAFGELTAQYRRALLVHCYRMLGTIDDAEDAVQDTYVRAWNGRSTFRAAISLRAWLYRIATNACLDAIERRKRGGTVEQLGVGPIPDDLLESTEAGPEPRYDAHESISLAFLTALQVLPPRQRAVLILRDVLSWRAAEAADLLDLSVPAVNSALHRARSAVSARYDRGDRDGTPRTAPSPGPLRTLLERYVRAWESADVAGLVALLRDDAIVSMPPGLTVVGREGIAAFLGESVFVDHLRIRLRPTWANRSPAFAIYSGPETDDQLRGYAVLVLEVSDTAISRMSVFADAGLIDRFGLPAQIPS